MRGWVYIITNQAMPGLLKIGYSMKDPILRAKELDHTGAPHPYLVAYDALMEDPRDVEQSVHRELDGVREGKEWFKCSCRDAIAVIVRVAGERLIFESSGVTDSSRSEEGKDRYENVPATNVSPDNLSGATQEELPKDNEQGSSAGRQSAIFTQDCRFPHPGETVCPHCRERLLFPLDVVRNASIGDASTCPTCGTQFLLYDVLNRGANRKFPAG